MHREGMEDPRLPRVFPPRAGLPESMQEPRGGFGGSLKSWGWRSLGRALLERRVSSEDRTQWASYRVQKMGPIEAAHLGPGWKTDTEKLYLDFLHI